jgi:hypothetical protein
MDLRWSYYAIGALVLLGIFINLVIPHGWTVWPLVMAAAIMLMVHEAADRNGTGLPPLQVYALAGAGLVGWMIVVSVLSVFNPIILLLAIVGMGYYCTRRFLEARKKHRIAIGRRELGLCVHCGDPIDPQMMYCANCGREPNPDQAILERISATQRNASDATRARAALKQDSLAGSASKREQALIARRRAGKIPPKRR